ncbi:hypothetical protein ACFU6M_22350 [Streptomyces bottropensis]|uniref:hypothetical protein n=1 Tax=Streptomyces bottropensis TaxID=42235 RepID=UPI0036979A53
MAGEGVRPGEMPHASLLDGDRFQQRRGEVRHMDRTSHDIGEHHAVVGAGREISSRPRMRRIDVP